MEKLLEYGKYVVVVIGTVFTWLFGTWDVALCVLIAFMVMDYLTGVIKAFVNKEVSSSIGLVGIARKSLILLVLIVAVLLDRLINSGTWLFRTIVCYFYIANEGISLLENTIAMGLPVPEQIKDALIQLKEGNKKDISKE